MDGKRSVSEGGDLAFLDTIAAVEFTQPDPEKGIGRTCYAFSAVEDRAFDAAQKYVHTLCERYALGPEEYKIQIDAIGNLFVTIYGKNRKQYVMSGSHLDSVANGGVYDGVAGVNAAVNFLETAIKHRHDLEYSYRVAMWRAEESSPSTGVTCLGSRVATGTITLDELNAIQYTTDSGEKIPFLQYFERRYGSKRVKRLVHETCHYPFIKAQDCIAYEELHIEQSGVCHKKQVEHGGGSVVGIVVDGIGSANRYRLAATLEPKTVTVPEEQGENALHEFSITFLGQAAHSGGTPPNLTAEFVSKESWYRVDALVAAAQFLHILKPLLTKNGAFVLANVASMETGYTTIPAEQTVRLLAPASFKTALGVALDIVLESTQTRVRTVSDSKAEVAHIVPVKKKPDLRQVITTALNENNPLPDQHWLTTVAKPGTYQVITESALDLVNIPLIVEAAARESLVQARRQHGVHSLGTIRATITDFCLQPDQFSAKLDLRDVNGNELLVVKGTLWEKLAAVTKSTIRKELAECMKTVSEKPSVPLSETAIALKRKLAKEMGIETVEMPSFPGHDAASIVAASQQSSGQTQVGLTFVAHARPSHSHFEDMDICSYEDAEALIHACLRALLGIRSSMKKVFA